MVTLETIRRPVSDEFAGYEEFIRNSLSSDNGYIVSITDYIFNNRGKGVRPLLVMLCAAMLGEGRPLGTRTYTSAMLIEMMHTASLVHDDVVDEAYMRRGKPSVNALWHSRKAVLVGDFILARSLCVAMTNEIYDVLNDVTRCVGLICEGELMQSEQSDKLSTTREMYLDIISRKTASLIAVSCTAGATSVGAEQEVVDRLHEYGQNIGMAFQIKDDILDYTLDAATGKPVCNDLRERKITLPLLVVLDKASEQERKEIIARLADVRNAPENVEWLHSLVLESGGMDESEAVMNGYLERARAVMNEFPESECRDSLIMLCDYIGKRNS